MNCIGNFELIDHGLEQSWDACTSLDNTGWEYAVAGIGDNPAKAIANCLEQVAPCGFRTEDMEDRIMAQKGWKELPTLPSVLKEYGEEACETRYYVSFRWNPRGRLSRS